MVKTNRLIQSITIAYGLNCGLLKYAIRILTVLTVFYTDDF